MPLSPFQAPAPGQWNLSLLYLRVDREPRAFFLSRTIYGAEILLGEETNALTVGAARRTRHTPPDNAFLMLHFESSRPMDARAKFWFDVPETGAVPGAAPREEIGK